MTGAFRQHAERARELRERAPRADAGQRALTPADAVTLAGYAFGLWWARGGPAWAALLSCVADEADGRLCRASGTCSAFGSALDWGADVALLPLALDRVAREAELPAVAYVAPVVLGFQAAARARGERPAVGSARAVVMLAGVLLEAARRGRGKKGGA